VCSELHKNPQPGFALACVHAHAGKIEYVPIIALTSSGAATEKDDDDDDDEDEEFEDV
jgi:hypothetical protein